MNITERFAANYIIVPGKGQYRLHYIERKGNEYSLHPLTEEIESVVWVEGAILLEDAKASPTRLVQVHPYDFENNTIPSHAQITPL